MTTPLRHDLREALHLALKARDETAVSALRSTLAAIDNAEAVAHSDNDGGAGAIEHSPRGVGAAEVARRELTEEDVERLVRGEIDERAAAARQYDAAGQHERATRLRAEGAVLAAAMTAHESRR